MTGRCASAATPPTCVRRSSSCPTTATSTTGQGGQQVYNAAGDLIWVGGKQEGQEYGVAYAYRMIDIVRSEADLQNFAWYVDTTPSSGTIYGPGVWATLDGR